MLTTETNLWRLAKGLDRDLAAARAAYDAAALAALTSEDAVGELARLRRGITALEVQRADVEAASRAATVQASADAARAARQEQYDAAARARVALREAVRAAQSLEQHVLALGPLFDALREAESAWYGAVARHLPRSSGLLPYCLAQELDGLRDFLYRHAPKARGLGALADRRAQAVLGQLTTHLSLTADAAEEHDA